MEYLTWYLVLIFSNILAWFEIVAHNLDDFKNRTFRRLIFIYPKGNILNWLPQQPTTPVQRNVYTVNS